MRKLDPAERERRRKEQRKRYYAQNREKHIARVREWTLKNAEHRRQYRAKHYAENRAEYLARAKQWRQENPEKYRAWVLKHRAKNREELRRRSKLYRDTHPGRHLKAEFGLTLSDYETMLSAQDGRCAICRGTEPFAPRGTRFAVDHDHATGDIRGLLCGKCNMGLGLLRDSPAMLAAALAYLKD